MFDKIKSIRSPNYYKGRLGCAADTLVLHYTAGRREAVAVGRYFAVTTRASAHYVVGRDGGVVQCVALDDGAWHAGDGRFPSTEQLSTGIPVPLVDVQRLPRINCRSVGIELCNRGWAPGGPNPYVTGRHRNPASQSTSWESYTDEQIDSLVRLIGALPADIRWVTAHEDITHQDTLGHRGAKLDVGPAFPWQALRPSGLRRVAYDWRTHRWEQVSL